MIKRYCDRCGQQIDEGVHAWYVLELHGTDGEFRHKELCEECYEYLCEKDEVPNIDRKKQMGDAKPIPLSSRITQTEPQTDDRCIGCKLTDGENCYCPEDCEVCDRDGYKTEPQTDTMTFTYTEEEWNEIQDWKDRMWTEAVIEPQTECKTCKHYKLTCELFSEICKYELQTERSSE